MPVVSLPDRPHLDQLRKQARDLLRAVRVGDPVALDEVRRRYGDATGFSLSTAQLVVARRYGFASWAGLKRQVELRQRLTRSPDPEDRSLADAFLRLACLNYDDDSPGHRAGARQLLAERPELARESIHVAAAVGDPVAVARLLAVDPRSARVDGGPNRWQPLLYLAYARHDPAIDETAVLNTARLLLAAGADPNAGCLWHGLPTPFTVLTGVFGGGERGPDDQPPHPHVHALARLLLEAGAEANDGQTLYNRQFEPDDEHLRLLFEFGLGTGTGGVWKRRLGRALPSPAGLLRRQLHWAVTHGMTARVELLLRHGVDGEKPFSDGTSPAELAARTGHPELIEVLVAHGVPRPDLDPVTAFTSAALLADRDAVDSLRAANPGLTPKVRQKQPALMVWAAVHGRSGSVELLAELGFDVNALGRSDVPRAEPWQTALHEAADAGNVELARTLLRLGADPTIRDARFDGTPLDWAQHQNQPAVAALLREIEP